MISAARLGVWLYLFFSRVKVRDAIRMLEKDGWYLVRTRGSHHQYKHPMKKGLVTIPGGEMMILRPAH